MTAERPRRSADADMPSAQGCAALRFSTDEVLARERMTRWRELFGRHIVDAQFEALPDAHRLLIASLCTATAANAPPRRWPDMWCECVVIGLLSCSGLLWVVTG
jgi:hypothetical protein